MRGGGGEEGEGGSVDGRYRTVSLLSKLQRDLFRTACIMSTHLYLGTGNNLYSCRREGAVGTFDLVDMSTMPGVESSVPPTGAPLPSVAAYSTFNRPLSST